MFVLFSVLLESESVQPNQFYFRALLVVHRLLEILFFYHGDYSLSHGHDDKATTTLTRTVTERIKKNDDCLENLVKALQKLENIS